MHRIGCVWQGRDRPVHHLMQHLHWLAEAGEPVLQIGCDPKHGSTFTLASFLISTIIDAFQVKDFHYESVWPVDVIYTGFGGVECVEAGGPPLELVVVVTSWVRQ